MQSLPSVMRRLSQASILLFGLFLLPLNAIAAEKEKVVFETSQGKIVLELLADKAPIAVKNFLHYVDSGFYNGTIFHRVIPNFVIQGGGFTAKMEKKDTIAPIKNESNNGISNRRGTLSMARLPDPDSATSQFFINLRRNKNLDYKAGKMGYAVFAEIVEGLEVVDKIAATKTGTAGHFRDVPKQAIVITSAYRAKKTPISNKAPGKETPLNPDKKS